MSLPFSRPSDPPASASDQYVPAFPTAQFDYESLAEPTAHTTIERTALVRQALSQRTTTAAAEAASLSIGALILQLGQWNTQVQI
jgi:hypothetical protein